MRETKYRREDRVKQKDKDKIIPIDTYSKTTETRQKEERGLTLSLVTLQRYFVRLQSEAVGKGKDQQL